MVPETTARRVGRPAADAPAVPDDDEILERGLVAFAELGYEATSVRELARRLGVSHNFVNDRYGSKENFWRAVVDHAESPVVAELKRILAAPYEDDVDRFRDGIRAFLRGAGSNPHLSRIMSSESGTGAERIRYVYERHLGPIQKALTPMFEKLVAEGRIRAVPVDVMLFSAIAMTEAASRTEFLRLLGPTAETDRDGFFEMLGDIVLDGLVLK